MPMTYPAAFKGKVALVTGSSCGVGRAGRCRRQRHDDDQGPGQGFQPPQGPGQQRRPHAHLSTPTWDRFFTGASFEQDMLAKAVARFPMGRPPSADEVAEVAVFLASDAAAQVTGQTISVNGGLSFGGW
jgi:NAD(P)-dependent dehydrogenase (short-subunit alcohol dehydrogenase family)